MKNTNKISIESKIIILEYLKLFLLCMTIALIIIIRMSKNINYAETHK